MHVDRRRAGDWSLADEVRTVRQRLPVPGAWAYGRKGDVVVVVVDECYTDDEIAQLVELVKLKLSFSDGDENNTPR